MKQILLIFFLLTFFLTTSHRIFSQDFISENKTWNVAVKVGFDEQITIKTITYKFLGDTTVQQINYKKLLETDNEQKSNWKLNSLWFEKNDSVFKYSSKRDENILIYAFNITEQDSFPNRNTGQYLYVDSIRTKVWGVDEREFIYFHPSESDSYLGDQTIWIKGIGQTGNFTISTEIGFVGGTSSLICFEEDGELVYQNPEYNSCSVFTAVSTIKKESEIVEIYNPGENRIIVNPLTTNPGVIQIFDIKGNQIFQEEMELEETQICLPITGIYIYRVISKTGELQNGKIIVR